MVEIKHFFDAPTFTLTYVVWDPTTLDAIVIDSVRDYDPASSKVADTAINGVLTFLTDKRLKVKGILETHAHADHVTAAPLLKERFPNAITGIGKRITEVQKFFSDLFDLGPDFPTNGRQFDHVFEDGEEWKAGSIAIKVRFTPGHTPACVSYQIEDHVFTGDALFMPDYGVGRCDFPAGSADRLFDSVTSVLYTMPDSTRTYTGHDYQPNGREVRCQSTVGEQKASNVHLNSKTTREQFIQFRTARDKTLAAPRLLLPSIQMNIDAGRLPPKRGNGMRYLTIPIFDLKGA